MPADGLTLTEGAAEPLGVTLDAAGANVAVFSEAATSIDFCVFDADGRETRATLPARTGSVWHGHAAGLRAGQAYGFRAHGPYATEEGLRFNPAKLLLDPYARALSGPLVWDETLVGEDPSDPGLPDRRDSGPRVPKCLALADPGAIDPAELPRTPWDRTVIYEAHVKGLTWLWPDLEPSLRGTIEALAAPGVIAHLKALGITAIELLPVHAFTTERRLAARGLVNYWGYNTVSFFAPEPRYLGPNGLDGVRQTVRRLHAAGIEVILDVVYNHTGESDQTGPTICFRGLDNLAYYRRDPDGTGGYANETGCGNTLNLAHPAVLRLVMDSLRWWATRIGVDGFRFDLAPALTRGPDGFRHGSAFLAALLQDPALRALKLIAEPWDIGAEGYRLGRFPAPFAEWNDRFRDADRAFWLGASGAGADLGDALLGSAHIFDRDGRRPWSSINAVAAHDGFTLADLTRYSRRRNAANGEGGRDGHDHNLSDDMGVEGPSDAPEIAAPRRRRQRNLLAIVFLAQGTPMLRAGDEIGDSQQGNNNAYCQDNETSWIDWPGGDADLLDFSKRLIALRRETPALRQASFLHGAARASDGLPDVEWLGLDGGAVDWPTAEASGLALLLRPAASDGNDVWALVAVNPSRERRQVAAPLADGRVWRRALDTGDAVALGMDLEPETVAVFVADQPAEASQT